MPPLRERLERTVALAVGALPEFVRSRLVPDRAVQNGETLDSRIAMLTLLAARSGKAFRPDVTPAAFRRGYAQTNRTMGLRTHRLHLKTRDLRIPTDDGDIPARLYYPILATQPVPLLVYFHGGGFVIGDIDSYDHLARFFALRGGIAVLSVGYRLGPEHRFPRAHEDAFAAFAFAQTHASELGADPARIVVGGDSAGGGLAAAISAFATSRNLASPDAQLLIYPSLDSATDRPSRRYTAPGAPFTPATMAWFAPLYVSSEADRLSPLLSPFLGPVPPRIPTYLLAAGFDPLVDEGFAYAERLRAAGVAVSYDLRPTLSHAFVNFAGVVPEARRALDDAIRVITMELRNR
jgi:acetyl esterase